ncbi:MAG: ADP-ribosylglycohydrolase family protein [Prolixibacteraceae bacterium]
MNRRFFLKNSGTTLGAVMIIPTMVTGESGNLEESLNPSDLFKEKIIAALYGIAIGESMGAPVEGCGPKALRERFPEEERLTEFIPGTDKVYGKGYGRITDDTLLTEALIRTYTKAVKHLDAYDYEEFFLPEISKTKVFIPEKQINAPIIERLFYPDKYPWEKLTIHNSEPRSTGIGNMVNCGLAISIMPIGAVNAGDPRGAYLETASFGLAHNESYGIEGGAVMAAAYAEAFRPGANIDSIISRTSGLAKDGTKDAILSAIEVVNTSDSMNDVIRKIRRAFLPFSGVPCDKFDYFTDFSYLNPTQNKNTFRPSRVYSIEELPVCLAILKYGNGDFYKTLTTSVLYGNDNDSIAGMACGLFGALYGLKDFSKKLIRDVEEVNKRNFAQTGEQLFNVANDIYKNDIAIFAEKRSIFK